VYEKGFEEGMLKLSDYIEACTGVFTIFTLGVYRTIVHPNKAFIGEIRDNPTTLHLADCGDH
jgi:hypothetical protein